MSRYSVILFCRFFAEKLVRIDVLEADEDAVDAGAARFGDEVRDAVAQRVDLDDELDVGPLALALEIKRSKIGSQSLLRAKLSSVMKKRLMPCARLRRTMPSTSSAERRRDWRPCTLMMVQNEHWKGQPRPASKLVSAPPVRLMRVAGKCGSGTPSSAGRSSM